MVSRCARRLRHPHPSQEAKLERLRSLAITLGILVFAACGGDRTTAPVSEQLLGTWVLVSVNEVQAPPGTLTWTISSTTITAESGPPDPCVEVAIYTVSGNRITGTTKSLSGTGCGGEVGDIQEFTFDVAGDTLTTVHSDPDLGTATFVFRRE